MSNYYQMSEYRSSVLAALRECPRDPDVVCAMRFEWSVSLRTTQTIMDDDTLRPMTETEVAFTVEGYSEYADDAVVDEETRFRHTSPQSVARIIAGHYLSVYEHTRDMIARRAWETLLDAEYPDNTLEYYHYGDVSIYTAVAEMFVDTVSQDDVLWVIHEYGETLIDPLRDGLVEAYEEHYAE